MKHVFIIALVTVAMIGVMVPSEVFAAEQDTQITFKRSHASIYYGETITFSGSLKDGLGYALSYEEIVIWDKDTLDYELVVSTRTDARGNYKVSVTAEYWDGGGGQAELIAHFSGNGFNKEAVTKSAYVNVDVPRNTYSEPENIRTITNGQSSYLSLEVMKGSESNTFRVKSSLYDLAGNNIPNSSISVYANNQYKGSVTAGQWSHSMSCDPGNNLIKISTNQFQYGVITYFASNDSEYFTCKSTSNSTSSSVSSGNKDSNDGAKIAEKQYQDQQKSKITQLETKEQLKELFLEKYTLLDSIKSDFQKLVNEQKLLKQKLENFPSDFNQNKVNSQWDELKENQKQIDQLESLIKTTEGTLNAGRGAEKYFELMDEKQISIISKIKWIKVGIDGVDGWGPQEDETDRIYKTPEGNYEYEKISDREEGGGCLIATATYGSEMATEVQQLRELRDNQLLQTASGTQFMGMFNDVYYSFSPIVADYERENPLFKEVIKIAITPMISSLSLMENANSESEVMSLGLSVIMLNIGMYLGVPAIVIVGIKKKF
jgi:hypothetical protein